MATTNIDEPMALPLHVRMINNRYSDELKKFTNARIMQAQMQAKYRIKVKLKKRYGTDATLRVATPITSFPIQYGELYQDQYAVEEYQESTSKYLSAIGAAAGVYSDQWTITFTSATAFTLSGLFTGSQGTGATSANFTSTNGYITILSTDWVGTFVAKDQFFITTSNYHPLITFIASLLTAGYLIGYENVETGRGDTFVNNPLISYAEKLLKELADPKSGVALDTVAVRVNRSPVAIDYDVNNLGINVSDRPDRDDYGNQGELSYPFIEPTS